jgi:hypothetical protein
MTTTTCAANCRQPLNRGEAVIRTNLHEQLAFHPHCFTVIRALSGVPAVVDVDCRVGGTLGERLARVYAEHERMGA